MENEVKKQMTQEASILEPPSSNFHLPPPPSNQWSPTVSIIIPTLNSAKTLRACLESIAMHDYPKEKLEIIIADAGSADQTLDIISEFSVASNLEPQTSNCSFPASRFHPLTSILSPPTFKSSPTICRPARLAKPQQ